MERIIKLEIQKQLQTQVKIALSGKNIPSALIEAGNFYGEGVITSQHLFGLQIGAQIANQLETNGIQVTRAILIDYYHHARGNKDIDYAATAEDADYHPDIIFYEHEYLPQAKKLIEILLEKKRAKKNGEGVIRYKADKLIDEFGKVSCAAFETPIHIDKAKRNPGSLLITVLPALYRDQQHLVQALLKELGEELPTLVVYFTDQGEVSTEMYHMDFLDF